MISTSCKQLALGVLEQCLAGEPPKMLPRALVQDPCGHALFTMLVEGLADRFEPALCDAYARLFSQAIAMAVDNTEASSLVARYERVRRVRPVSTSPKRVSVLSRITLGADVAVTSVLLAAAKKKFPKAEIVFVGPKKNYELFAADARITHAEAPYRRGSLRERLESWTDLRSILDGVDCLVIDPDSRLTQLGLLPVCAEDHYHLFESRGYGRDSDANLPELAAAWAAETLGIADAKPYIAPAASPPRAPYVAVSLGVGENPAKRLPDPFEVELLRLLATRGWTLIVDQGAGGEEAERVSRAVAESGVKATLWEGPFAGFAAVIGHARLYAGYDSAGQHVAAAAGVPLISVFAGFPVPRMFDRWRPTGPRSTVIRVDKPDLAEILAKVKQAVSPVPAS